MIEYSKVVARFEWIRLVKWLRGCNLDTFFFNMEYCF